VAQVLAIFAWNTAVIHAVLYACHFVRPPVTLLGGLQTVAGLDVSVKSNAFIAFRWCHFLPRTIGWDVPDIRHYFELSGNIRNPADDIRQNF
jgi:hypothetical protein